MLREHGITKEVRVEIKKNHKVDFVCGASAPPRIRIRRGSVATERYVAAENIDNDFPPNESDDIEIDQSVNRNPQMSIGNYSATQLQNFAAFGEIPNALHNPSRFLQFLRSRRESRQVQTNNPTDLQAPLISTTVPQAGSLRAAINRDACSRGVSRMFEIAPQNPRAQIHLVGNRSSSDLMPQAVNSRASLNYDDYSRMSEASPQRPQAQAPLAENYSFSTDHTPPAANLRAPLNHDDYLRDVYRKDEITPQKPRAQVPLVGIRTPLSDSMPQAAYLRAPINDDDYLRNVSRMFEASPQGPRARVPLAENYSFSSYDMPQATNLRASLIRADYSRHASRMVEMMPQRPQVSVVENRSRYSDPMPQAANMSASMNRSRFSLIGPNFADQENRRQLPRLDPIAPPVSQANPFENHPAAVPNMLDDVYGFLDHVERVFSSETGKPRK